MELQRTRRKRSCRRKKRLERKDRCSEETRVGVTEEDEMGAVDPQKQRSLIVDCGISRRQEIS